MSTRSRLCLALALLCVGGALLTWPPSQPEVAPTDCPARPIPYAETSRWLDRLKSRSRVRFLERIEAPQRDAGSDSPTPRVLAELTSLGPLPEKDRATAAQLLSGLYESRTQKLTRLQATMSTSSARDAHIEAKAAMAVEACLCMQEQLRSGDYTILPPDQQLPPDVGVEVTSMGILCKGVPANIWFVIDSPAVASLKQYVDATREVWLDEVATEFNRLPLAERQRLIESHDANVAVHRSKWSKAQCEQETRWFPAGISIHRESATLQRFERR